MKRKIARISGEMADMKLLLEKSQSRNAELEKKQRRLVQIFVVFFMVHALRRKTIGLNCSIVFSLFLTVLHAIQSRSSDQGILIVLKNGRFSRATNLPSTNHSKAIISPRIALVYVVR